MRKYVHFLWAAVALACAESSPRRGSSDTVARSAPPTVSAIRVNHGTYGMAAAVKWILAPDSSAILALVDPVGVEAEALPNAFFYGSETWSFQVRMDSVWDVAVSPDWRSIAFSRAYLMNAGESDTLPASAWVSLSRRTGIDTATLRTSSFQASGMAYVIGVAQPGVIQVPADVRAAGASESAAPRMFRIARGWRIAWTSGGDLVALGNNPSRVQDDEESVSWASLDPRTGVFHGSLPSGEAPARKSWTAGPVLDISQPVDMSAAAPVEVARSDRSFLLESRGGVISARETTPGVAGVVHPIGAGKALAATRGGKYILALAPRARAEPYENPVEAVVYTVAW